MKFRLEATRCRPAVAAATALALTAAIGFAAVPSASAAGPRALATGVGSPVLENDSFYTPAAGYESTAPGTILRSRPTKVTFFATVPQKAKAWQLLYRTTDQLGQPEATVTTVLIPAGAAPDSKRPLVSYQPATDSASPACAPSRALTASKPNPNIYGQADILFIDSLLVKGYAVSVPDYEGPKAAFGATKQAGHAILDGLRATSNFAPLGLSGPTTTPMGLIGYSGGSVASNGAAEAQPGYAPELDIRGIAAGGSLGTDVVGVLLGLNGSFGAGLGAAAIAGIAEAYPEFASALIDRFATEEGRAALASLKTMCTVEAVATFAFKDISQYLTVSIDQALADPLVQQIIDDDSPGQTAPTAPMYMWHGVSDELLGIKGVDDLVKQRCAQGSRIEYRRDLLAEHGVALLTGIGGALTWLDDRLNGKPVSSKCSTKTVLSNLVAPGTAKAFGSQLIYSNVLALLGQAVGGAGPY